MGKSALLLAATGSGKTLAAFLAAIDRIMFERATSTPCATMTATTSVERQPGVGVLYISPLKALGVDVDRNLRAPIAGITEVAARHAVAYRAPRIAIRSGDTDSRERLQIARKPPDILISTPESLFLLLTSKARAMLSQVHTVIIDEIHTMVSTKRGAHLFLSLERLEYLRRGVDAPMQRIGLSATQHPVEEAACLLGGFEHSTRAGCARAQRPIAIVDAREPNSFALRVEMSLDAQLDRSERRPLAGDNRAAQASDRDDPSPTERTSATTTTPSIWSTIYPRLVELIYAHRSTMIFVNSRRLAERMAQALNEASGEEIAQAHHGALARDTRTLVEDRLKRGELPAIVATSSLELGLDIGAVDLVIQIESPPSVSSGLQRIGRSGHQVDGRSAGIIFPKYRSDLLATAAAARGMLEGAVESSRYLRNPLDVLAQQIVAMVALDDWSVEALFHCVRGSAPFAELPRSSFDGVLDLLAGRYPSDEFAALVPRITWDRLGGALAARKGAQRTAILNAGTIADRGLYGVFLFRESGPASKRVGELDEEMVFELNLGDVFRLGVSTWRVLEINRDQVIVEPAPGEPGKMPFWRGDGLGRPLRARPSHRRANSQTQRFAKTRGGRTTGSRSRAEYTSCRDLVRIRARPAPSVRTGTD